MTKTDEQTTENIDPAWLLDFLRQATARNLCTKIGCTTCGARDLGLELTAETHRVYSKPDGLPHPAEPALFLSKCLSRLDPPWEERDLLRRPVMWILYDLERVFAQSEDNLSLDNMLGDSWAGEILAGMRAHHRMVCQQQLDYQRSQNPEFIRAERARKRALRAQRHAERLEKKKECDRMWRAMNG